MEQQVLNKIVNYSIYKSNLQIDKKEIEYIVNYFISDKTTTIMRELITLAYLGVDPYMKKNFYDGVDKNNKFYEVKTMNVISYDKKKKRLNGGGSYNDLTWKRHKKYLEDNPNILVSGFVDGFLVYIFQFEYSIIKDKIELSLMNRLGSIDQQFQYLRSFKFNFKDWKENYKKIFITDNSKLLIRDNFTIDFWNFLIK